MTGDLMLVANPGSDNRKVTTEDFIAEVAKRLEEKL